MMNRARGPAPNANRLTSSSLHSLSRFASAQEGSARAWDDSAYKTMQTCAVQPNLLLLKYAPGDDSITSEQRPALASSTL